VTSSSPPPVSSPTPVIDLVGVIGRHVLDDLLLARRQRTTPRVVKRAISNCTVKTAKGRVRGPSRPITIKIDIIAAADPAADMGRNGRSCGVGDRTACPRTIGLLVDPGADPLQLPITAPHRTRGSGLIPGDDVGAQRHDLIETQRPVRAAWSTTPGRSPPTRKGMIMAMQHRVTRSRR
jgi:hypothetical protein